MMDYEKAYKEAIERAKANYESSKTMGFIDIADTIMDIFPELRESEDERIREFLVDYFASYKIGNVTTKLNGVRIDDILTYLEKQKEQKPVEWSEEDEDKLYRIIETLLADKEVARRENPQHYDVLCKAYDELIDWLKSLRPQGSKDSLQTHWKPSEDQMEMLAMFTNLRCASRREANTLESLYNDLKKLM